MPYPGLLHPEPLPLQKPQQDGRRDKIMFRIKPHTSQRHSEVSNIPCVPQDPETPQGNVTCVYWPVHQDYSWNQRHKWCWAQNLVKVTDLLTLKPMLSALYDDIFLGLEISSIRTPVLLRYPVLAHPCRSLLLGRCQALAEDNSTFYPGQEFLRFERELWNSFLRYTKYAALHHKMSCKPRVNDRKS